MLQFVYDVHDDVEKEMTKDGSFPSFVLEFFQFAEFCVWIAVVF